MIMNAALNDLRISLVNENIASKLLASDSDIQRFKDLSNIELPDDLIEYFKIINGSDCKYDQNFFQFYSLRTFKSLEEMYLDWNGVPDFKAIAGALPDYQNCFVIADYSIHVISYSIRLKPDRSTENDVFAICGSKYKLVANSFTEFIKMYLEDASSLFI